MKLIFATVLSFVSVAGASGTKCEPTGKYFELNGAKYDSSVLNEFTHEYSCSPVKGGTSGFTLVAEGCQTEKVNLSVEQYVPGKGYEAYYFNIEISGKAWEKISNGNGHLNVNAGNDLVSLKGTGTANIFSVTRSSNGSSEVLECKKIEGDG